MNESAKEKWEFFFGAAQTLIFLVMVWSMWQTKDSIDISRKQLQATIEPIIGFGYDNIDTNGMTRLVIKNWGVVAVSDIRIKGVLHAVYSNNWSAMRSSYLDMDEKPSLYQGEFKSGMTTNCSLQPYIHAYDPVNHTDPVDVNRTNELEVIGLIIRYNRTVDMKPYGQLLVVGNTGSFLAPIEPHMTSGPRGSLETHNDPFIRTRREIEQKLVDIGVGDLITPPPQVEPSH